MTRIAFLALSLTLLATTAQALSCLRPDAVRLFEQARDAEDAFYVVKGRVFFLETPNLPVKGSEVPTETRARIEGQGLTPSGFNVSFDREVIVEMNCLGPWCPAPEGLEGQLIMAIRSAEDRLSLRLGPCGGDQVLWDEDGESRVLSCYRDGICEQNY